jgi:choline dehydrogenase-like flavoprotein
MCLAGAEWCGVTCGGVAGCGSGLDVAIPAASPTLQRTARDWQYKTTPQTHSSQHLTGRQVRWPRGRMLGGSSSINYMLYVRGHRGDYNEWAADYNATGWGYQDMLPYFLKSEGMTVRRAAPRCAALRCSWLVGLTRLSAAPSLCATDPVSYELDVP